MKSKYGLLKILLILLAVVICGVIYSCTAGSSQSETSAETSETSETVSASGESEEETTSVSLLCVHVCGAVNNPGVYYLNEGSRVHQAIEMAGGLSDTAASDYINLADLITDGEQIYIPTADEIEEGSFTTVLSGSAGDSDGLVNINTADVSELSTLPGIGESKADAIISYRENVSQFESIEDIKNVSGIGDSVYEKIKDSIKVK